MARFVAGVALGLALGLVISARADDQPDEVLAAAAEAGVDPAQLVAALDTLAAADIPTDARSYLESTGELARPEPPPAPRFTPSFTPAGPPSGLAARVACIERKESGGANVANLHGSGAGGVMQYFPSTFARGAREMGHPEWSLWNPAQARAVAAHDLAMGRRSQWTVSGCN